MTLRRTLVVFSCSTIILVSGAFSGAMAGDEPSAARQAPARARVGLALGGGAARGIAHIGLLKWMEEHRVPADVIAGTSMGGLVGGAYASGLSIDELRALIVETDWDLVFLADSPFRFKTFRRKEDARAFPAQIEFGLKGGFKVPTGLNPGQQIQMIFDRLALPYYDVTDFDELPIPFRSVATDLRASETVVLGSGSLSTAMRATMAIPALFTPVEWNGKLLVDGGVLYNVPSRVAREMGATVVIAVNVGASTDPPSAPTSLFGVLGQTLDTMMSTGTRAGLKDADLVITPDLKGLTGMDWRRGDELIARGYAAGEAARDHLLPYALDEAAYAEWTRAREARRRTVEAPVQAVRIEGVSEREQKEILRYFEQHHVGVPLSRAILEEDILLLTGTDRYELVAYSLESTPTGLVLVLRITPKAYGPPFLLPAIDVQNIDSNTFAVDLRARLAVYDTFVTGSEMRIDGGIGSRQFAGIEFYRRLGGTGLFVAPRASFLRKSVNFYDDDRQFLAEYREKRSGAGLDVGFTTGAKNEVRLGYDIADVRVRRRIGAEASPEASGSDRVASLRWTYDGQTSPVIPTRGVLSRATLRYYFATPDLQFVDGSSRRAKDFLQGEWRVSAFQTWRTKERLFLSGGAGTSFGDDPGYYAFRLGGPLRLGAFNNEEISGNNYVLVTAGLLHQVFRLPDVLGGNAYLGGWLEQGSAFDEWEDADYYANLSVGFVMETLFGPFFIGGSVSLNSGDTRVYVSLAPFVR